MIPERPYAETTASQLTEKGRRQLMVLCMINSLYPNLDVAKTLNIPNDIIKEHGPNITRLQKPGIDIP